MPKLAEFFSKTASQEAEKDKKRPTIVSMTPANGATGVKPGANQIQIVFDRPMRESWSFVGGDKHTPKLGDPSLDASRKIITVPVQLKPNWTYRYWLNSDRFKNFASAEGIPLRPVKVEFKTGE